MATGGVSGGEGWRECTAWLTRCGVIRPDHKANWPEATVADLAYTLRDGVVLCGLLNCLDPGCIDTKDVNQKPQMAQFLCLRNIKTFLTVCHEIFALKDCDLFDPVELFDLSNFLSVIQTLSRLSQCPRVARKGIEGFSLKTQNNQVEDDIYKTLNREEASAPELEAEYSSYSEYSQANEDIYQEIFSQSRHADLPAWLSQAVSTQSLEKRDYVIKELIETEKNYLEVLGSLLRHFLRPLRHVLLEEEHATIFAKVKDLYEVHSGFHSGLRKAVSLGPQSGGRLGEVFVTWREHFLVYGDYCANLPAAQQVLEECCSKNELLNQELARCQQEANQGKFKLRDILSVPMQRILKYHLLLEKLLQETQQSHEDYRNLERARDAMVDVAQYINEVKRDSDTLQIIRDIQKSISGWDMPENMELKDYGRLLKDGELRIKAHEDVKVRLRYTFIFDHLMLLCKATRNETYSFRECLRLADYRVEDVTTRRTLNSSSRWGFCWYLVHRSQRSAFTMYARTEELKRKWLRALQEALDNLDPPGSQDTDHKFVMFTFSRPHTCHSCSKYLKGRIFQGYQCEQCTMAVHKGCIPLSGRCGGRNHLAPPELPPRPLPSLSEPSTPTTPAVHERTLTRQPLAVEHNNQQEQQTSEAPPIPERGSMRFIQPPRSWTADICNNEAAFGDSLWFMGELSRKDAEALLLPRCDGTFLLRRRPQGPTSAAETCYALSLKTEGRVKHMKVYERDQEGERFFFLSESRLFKSIEELVRTYEHTSLSENFENFVGLDVTLQLPYRSIPAKALYDYEPTECNQLPLRRGQPLLVTSKEGDHKGWWKGRVDGRVGFFPKVYVRERTEDDSPF